MKAHALTPTQTRGLAAAFRDSIRREIMVNQIPTPRAQLPRTRFAPQPRQATLIDYLADHDWVIDAEHEGDDILCHSGCYTLRSSDDRTTWKLTKHSATRARLIEWETTFTSAPDAVIIATLNALTR